MKVTDLFEAAEWGSWKRTPTRQLSQSTGPSTRPSYGGAEDASWDTRLKGAAEEARNFKISGKSVTGTTESGKPYNVVVSIKGPSGGRLKAQVDKFLRTNENIHHNFVDIQVHPIEDEVSVAYVFIDADDQSLIKQATERGHYGN